MKVITAEDPKVHTSANVLPKNSKAVQDENVKLRMNLAARLMDLDVSVTQAKHAKIEFVEADDDIISYLCGGKIPDAEYVFYKDVRVCREGSAERIAKRENMTTFERLGMNK